jgi:hypothetical protein
MPSAAERVQSVTIVERRSGPGYRLVLCRITPRGTPVLETLPDSFVSIASARAHAVDGLGIEPTQVRSKVRADA